MHLCGRRVLVVAERSGALGSGRVRMVDLLAKEAAEKAADMIALNAGAALYVAGVASSLKNGVALAEDVIHGGRALEKMQELAAFTQGMTQ